MFIPAYKENSKAHTKGLILECYIEIKNIKYIYPENNDGYYNIVDNYYDDDLYITQEWFDYLVGEHGKENN